MGSTSADAIGALAPSGVALSDYLPGPLLFGWLVHRLPVPRGARVLRRRPRRHRDLALRVGLLARPVYLRTRGVPGSALGRVRPAFASHHARGLVGGNPPRRPVVRAGAERRASAAE